MQKEFFIKNIFQKILEIIFPNRCLSCNKTIGAEGLFCNEDWRNLQFITDPKCYICSQPFLSFSDGNKNDMSQLLCIKCLTNKPVYDQSIILFRYNNLLKKIISNMKYRDATLLSKKFGDLLWKKIEAEIKNYDLIIAVPLHKKRLRERKFNQAILLIKAILQNGKKIKILPKFYPDVLLREKYTTNQVGLDSKQRQKNMRNIFKVNKKYLAQIKEKNILLIDDVITTGATLENCSLALKKCGAKKITIATIAKTILEKNDHF